MKIKQSFILAFCCLLLLSGCGHEEEHEEEFAIEGQWKNVGEYTFGQVQEDAIIDFDGKECNLYSPSDTYSFYKNKNGDNYTLECTSLAFSETLKFDVEVIDSGHINLHFDNHVLELQRQESDSFKASEKELSEDEKKAKRQALQFVMYENLADENGEAVSLSNISPFELEGKTVKYNKDDVLLDGMDVKKAEIARIDSVNGEKENIVEVTFTSEGTDKFAQATAKAIGKQMAIISNGKLICAPTVQSEITDGECQIFYPSADSKEMQRLADTLN